MTDPTPPANNPPMPPAPGAYQPYGPQPQNGLGTAALVIGILQFVCLGPIASILAIIFGAIGRKKAKQGLATNGGVATAGFWLGIAGLILSVVAGIIIAAGVILGINAASESLDPANNGRTGLADGTYTMDPNSWIHVGDRCSFGGTPVDADTGQAGTSRVTVVGEGAAQCTFAGHDFDQHPDAVIFVVRNGVAEIVEVR